VAQHHLLGQVGRNGSSVCLQGDAGVCPRQASTEEVQGQKQSRATIVQLLEKCKDEPSEPDIPDEVLSPK
jgi:hypothetical protein